MKPLLISLLISLLLLSSLSFADKMYYFTIHKDNLVCSVDILVHTSGKISKDIICFTK